MKVVNEVENPQSYLNVSPGIARDYQTERLLSISLSVLCGPNFWLGRITDDKVAGRAFSVAVQQSQEGDITSQDAGTSRRFSKPEALSPGSLLINILHNHFQYHCPIKL